MANLKEVRNRMVSVKSTQQITRAMKMVSAAKLRRAQTKIQQMRPYAIKMNEMLGNVAGNIAGSNSFKYYEKRNTGKILFIVVTSDRGLCGGFNSSLFREMRFRFSHELKADYEAGNVDLYCIGKKGKELFQRYGSNIVGKHDGFFQSFQFEDSEKISNDLMDKFSDGIYKEVHLVYNRFKNAATYIGTVEQWLPIVGQELEAGASNANYIFEPSKTEILDELVPRSLRISLFKSLLDSNASEHGSRMTAMDSATENAQEMLRNLSIEYNKARQAAITTEILEIVGGAEALSNG